MSQDRQGRQDRPARRSALVDGLRGARAEASTQAKLNPFGTAAGIGGVVLGTAGVFLGDAVSRGMTLSLAHAALPVAHAWGTTFAIGGAAYLVGLYRYRPAFEVPGLWALLGGYAFYAITVVAGLQLGGFAAGTLAAAFTLGCALKLWALRRRVRRDRVLAEDPASEQVPAGGPAPGGETAGRS